MQRPHAVVQRVSPRSTHTSSPNAHPALLSSSFPYLHPRYGHSTGTPSEKGLRIDAQTALAFVKGNELLRGTKVIIYGQSIGGCVCLALAGTNGDQVSRIPQAVRCTF
jgi:pimeloyl-ACP methyl ester carboxylesterase